ncbi:MAG: Rpn family recombination-promoting nuclease/putative transposase [Synergistaceae bacterium]|nr:Rpn family recombination-promoting nuclease/putative transposase [Synergistaceae bacterium]
MTFSDETYKIINVGKNRINRLNDRFVKYLLTGPRSKPILIDFINNVLRFEGDERIVDLEIISGELVQDAAKMKLSILDVSAKLADGSTVDVEVQVINHHDFRKRAPFYWGMRHVKKLTVNMTYTQIRPMITICLLAFDLLEEEEAYRNAYSIRNDRSGNRLCEDLRIIYLELPKFLRCLGSEYPRTGLERWLLYFCNEEGERMEKAMVEDSVLTLAKELESSFWADAQERELYFAHQRLLLDAYSDEHTWKVLLEQEKEKSLKREHEVTRNLLKMGVSADTIAQASGLSVEEIQRLQD